MKKIIHNLRKKPAHVREQIAIMSALGVTAIVSFFWLSNLGSKYSTDEAKSSFKESLSPFKVLGNSAKDALSRSKAELSSISNGTINQTDGTVMIDENGVINLDSYTDIKPEQ